MKEKKWRIELTEHQLRLMAQCVEDCHRFIGGQMELSNSTACLTHHLDLSKELDKLQNERKEMANRSDRASVTAHGTVHRRLPQVHRRTDGVKQFHVLPYTLYGT